MVKEGIVSEILKQKKYVHQKRKKDVVKRTSIALPVEFYRYLKAVAAIEGRKMNDLMVELLQEGFKNYVQEKNLPKEWLP